MLSGVKSYCDTQSKKEFDMKSGAMAMLVIALAATNAAAGQAAGGGGSAGRSQAAGVSANPNKAKLRTPSQLVEKAPETYKARLDTSKGLIVIEVHRDWAPLGADRFYNLVKNGFYDDIRFFRVLDNFMAQFGINGDPAVMAAWRGANIKDDAVKQSNKRGFITFATGGPNTRTTQVFINFKDNVGLDGQGFSPFGEVVSGMDVVDKLYSGYGEGAPQGRGPDQSRTQMEGNAYLTKEFPKLDFIKKATIEK
jgi:peptidyl-prolyl cis-trans isomerase A (cyclophilin A)